jgi:putative hydrolase of the HAD superfamily
VVRVVVFDADETVVDLRPAVRGALDAVLAEALRLRPDAALTMADLEADWYTAYAALRADPVVEIRRAALALSLRRVGLDDALEALSELFFARRFALTRPFAETLPVLAELRCAYRVGLASNGNSHAARCGLPGAFDFEVYAHRNGVPKKPASGFFAAVLAEAGCPPASVVHIGDSWEHDVVGARAAGLRTVWLNRAGHPRPADGVADAEIRTLADLPAVLPTLL